MPNNLKLSESGFSLGKVTGKNRWRARLIKVGAGSSGFYTEDALRETGPTAFPAATKINADHHQNWRELEEQPAGSVTTLIGAIATEPVFADDGLYAEVEFSDEWAPFVEQFHPILGLSINASGYGSEMTEMGLPIIEGIIPSPLNTVDLVTVAGAGGKLLELVESFRESSAKMENEVPTQKNRKNMTPEEIQALTEALVKALREAVTPAPVVDADEPNGETLIPPVSDITEALVEADLPKPSREAVYKALETGVSVEDAIKAQQELIHDLQESANSEGSVKETTNQESFIVNGWTK